jgi:WD40 repeat protein
MPTHQFVFTPNGQFIVANDDTYKLAVWDTRTGQFVRSLGRSAQTIGMRRDGALVFQDHHSVVTLPVDGRPAAVQDEVSLGFPSFVLAADELSAFVTEGMGVTLRRLDGGGDLGRIDLKAYSDTAGALALSRDGTRLLVGTGSGVILNVRLGATGRN